MTFEQFAKLHLNAVLAFATVLAGQPAAAEDLVQEVLVRAYARWDRVGGLDRPDLYVRKMVLNEFLSWRRRSWRLVPAGTGIELGGVAMRGAAADSAPDHADRHAEQAAMLAQIARLPKRQRAVLALRYYEDRSDAEIAGLLGCAPSTVRSYASRALAALRVEMEAGQPESPRAGSALPGGI